MDLSHWAIVDVFTVEQAACLWVDKEPRLLYAGQHGREYSDAHAILQALTGAIVSGTLQADSSRNALRAMGDFRRSLVAREDLRAFAERKRQHPAFLFDTLLSEAESEGMKPQSLPREDADSGKSRGGRPQEYDWDAFTIEIIRLANTPDGLPPKQADLIGQMLQWCENQWEKQPAESSVKSRISRIYNRLGLGRKPGGQ